MEIDLESCQMSERQTALDLLAEDLQGLQAEAILEEAKRNFEGLRLKTDVSAEGRNYYRYKGPEDALRNVILALAGHGSKPYCNLSKYQAAFTPWDRPELVQPKDDDDDDCDDGSA